MKFSIIVVCLNPGTKLNQTLDSILAQTCPDFEVIVKDGGSRDGSIESMRTDGRIHLYQEPDHSIYEAMNQAVSHVTGDYILFLNCGDLFYDKEVLAHTAQFMEQHPNCRASITEIPTARKRTRRYHPRPESPALSATATFPAISPAFMLQTCADRSPMNPNIRSVQITNISSGAIIVPKHPCSIWDLPCPPTRAAATLRPRRT